MMNDLVRKLDPLALGKDAHQILLDGRRRIGTGQLQAARNAVDMSIHHHAQSLPKPRTQDDIGRFARNSRQREQFVHLVWDLSAEV